MPINDPIPNEEALRKKYETQQILASNRPFLKGLTSKDNPYSKRFKKPTGYISPGGAWSTYDSNFDNPFTDTADDIANKRSERQPWVVKALAFPSRTSTKAIAEIAKMPGMAGGIVQGIAGQIDDAFTGEDNTDFMTTAFDNAWINAVEDMHTALNDAVLPVYVDTATRDGKLADKIFDIDFWSTEGADGLGYVLAMFAPGAAIKAMNLGSKVFKPLAALGALGEKTTKIGAQLAKLGAPTTPKMFDLWTQTLANTIFESGAEAKGAMDSFRESPEYEKLLNELPQLEEQYYQKILADYELNGIDAQTQYDAEGNPTGAIIPTKDDMLTQFRSKAKQMAQKSIDDKISALGAKVFGANTVILVGPNAVMAKMLWGGARNTTKQAGKYVGLKNFGKDLGAAGAREGLWEEGAQSTTEQYFTKYDNIEKSLTDDFSADFVKSYAEMFGTTEGQTAMFLGAVYGGGMQAYMGIKDRSRDKKSQNRLEAAGDNALTNLFAFYETDIQRVDKDGKKMFRKDSNGNLQPIPDLDKLRKKLQSGKQLEILGAQFDLAEQNNDIDAMDAIKNIVYTHELKPYIINDNMGPEVLREKLQTSAKLDAIAAKNAAKKMAGEEIGSEPEPGALDNEKQAIINDIIDKAKELKKVYRSFQEFAPRVFDMSNENATAEEIDMFMNQMSMQYVDHHSERSFAKKKMAEKKAALQELLSIKNLTEEELTQEEADERVNILKEDINKLNDIVKEQTLNIEAFWNKNGKMLKDTFKAKRVEDNRLKELEDKYEKELSEKINEIKEATSIKELKKIEGIGVEALDNAIEIAKSERKKEIKEAEAKASKGVKEKATKEKDKKDKEKVEAAENIKFFNENLNEGEEITIPESFGTKFSGETAKIVKKGKTSIQLETKTGTKINISRETIFGSVSELATPYSIEGNPETRDEVQEEEEIEGYKQNPTDSFIMSTDANNEYKPLPWVDQKVIDFERDPRDKTGEIYGVELNDPSETKTSTLSKREKDLLRMKGHQFDVIKKQQKDSENTPITGIDLEIVFKRLEKIINTVKTLVEFSERLSAAKIVFRNNDRSLVNAWVEARLAGKTNMTFQEFWEYLDAFIDSQVTTTASNVKSDEKVEEIQKEVQELEELIEYGNNNKLRTNKKQKPVKEEVKEVVKKVVEKEEITEEEATTILEDANELIENFEEKFNKNIDNKIKRAKEVLTTMITSGAKVLNRLSTGVKNIIRRISNKLRALFLGITLIASLTTGVRTEAGNQFVATYMSQDMANVVKMSPSEILELAPNVVDKILGIGTYAETESNLDNLFKEDIAPVIYPQLEQVEEAPVVEEKFLANPINIAKSVYKRGDTEVKPWVMDLNDSSIKIELAVNTRSGAKAKNYGDAIGIIGATHAQFLPQSKQKVSNIQFPVSLTYNPVTKQISFKKNDGIGKEDMILPTSIGTFQPVSALNITPNDKGGYTIETAKDSENGTTTISSKRGGGSFHMGLAPEGYKGKTIESNEITSYRNLRGGMFIFTDAEASINIAISGSPNDIFRTLRKLEEKYPEKELYIFRGDTGTYSTSQMSTDGKVTADDIRFYSNKNTWGSNQFWVMKKPVKSNEQDANRLRNTSPEPSSSIPFLMSGLGLLAFRRRKEDGEQFTQQEINELKEQLKVAKSQLASRKAITAKKPKSTLSGNVTKALELWKAGKKDNIEFFIKYLPLNIKLTEGISAPISTLSDNPSATKYNQIFNNTTKKLRSAIIKEMILNNTPISNIQVKVAGQKGGVLMIAPKVNDKVVENNIKDLWDFQNDINNIKADLFYIVNDKGELINGKNDIWFAGRHLAPGEVYIMIKTANGTKFPLKLNIRKIQPEEAELLYELYKYRFDDVKEGKSIRVSETTPELLSRAEELFKTQLAVMGRNIKDVTIKDIVDFFIWDGTEHPESQVRFSNQETLKVAGENFNKETFNSDEARAEFIHTITERKRHHIRFKPRKGDTKYTKTLQDREYIDYIVGNKILNTNAVINEPTFQGETRMYLVSDGVMVNKKLSKYNEGLPKTFSKKLRGTNKELQAKIPKLFANPLKLTKDGRKYVDQQGKKYNRASDLKNEKKKVDFNSKHIFNSAKRGDVVDELVRNFFTIPIKKSEFLAKGNNIAQKIDKKRGGDELIFDDSYFEGLYDILEAYAAEFDKLNYTIYPNVPSFGGVLGSKGLFGGTIDLLAYDNTSKKYVLIDVKTTSNSRGDYYSGAEEDIYNYKGQDEVQLNAYRELFKQKTGIEVEKLLILPLTSKSEDKGVNSIYNEISQDENGMFLEVSTKKDIYKLRNISPSALKKAGRVDMAQAMREKTSTSKSDYTVQKNEKELPGAKNEINWEEVGIDLSAFGINPKKKKTVKKETPKASSVQSSNKTENTKKPAPVKAFRLASDDSAKLSQLIEDGVPGTELVYKNNQYVYFHQGHFFLNTDKKQIVLNMEEIKGIVTTFNKKVPPPMRINEKNVIKTWEDRFGVTEQETKAAPTAETKKTPKAKPTIKEKVVKASKESKEELNLDDLSKADLESMKSTLVTNFRKVDPKGFVKLLRDKQKKPIEKQVEALVEYLLAKKVSKDDIRKKCGL